MGFWNRPCASKHGAASSRRDAASRQALRGVGLAAAIAGWLLGAPTVGAAGAGKATQPGTTYESLKEWPDFSGGWVPLTALFSSSAAAAAPDTLPTGRINGTPLPRELKPELAARAASDLKQLLAGAPVERGYCEPRTFAGLLPMNAGGSLEILFTPGRVTLATESGLVRRIYLRDTPVPGALEESRTGTSIARWEGRTLVVVTTGISRNALLVGRIAVGTGARVVERISLQDANTLEVKSTITAPEVLTAPMTAVNRYQRARDRVFTEFDVCVQGDRAFDEASKGERFDATPPADLPPPPTG
jgi:hypothetical protein